MRKILFLLLTVLLFLPSCKEDSIKEKGDFVADDQNEVYAERADISDGLGEYDFGGRELRIVTCSPYEVLVEDEEINKGNLMKDAIYKRNHKVETRFNFKMKVSYTGGINEISDFVKKTVSSGADEFDLLVYHTMKSADLVLQNLFLNWYDIPNVDFSKPWWAKANADTLTYDGKCILAVSDLNYSSVSYTYCLVFNKELANAWDLGDLYSVASEGNWTFDTFLNIIKDVYTDTDGDGMRSSGDFYGMLQADQSHINQWLWAFDNPTVQKNEEGVPTLVVKTDKINNIISSLYDYCFNTDGVYFEVNRENPNLGSGSSVTDMFLSRQGIFTITTLGSLTTKEFRDFDDEYGILSVPKFYGAQKSYTNMTYGGHTVLSVPKTCPDTEFVGTAVEALSAESYKEVIPAFYEVALKTRYLRDNESKKMLELIIESRTFDFGYVYDGWKGFGWMLHNLLSEESSSFESYYQSRYANARNHYKKIVKIFDKLD